MYKMSITFDNYTIEVSNSTDVNIGEVISDFAYILKGFGKSDQEIKEAFKQYIK